MVHSIKMRTIFKVILLLVSIFKLFSVDLFLPEITENDQIIIHQNYTLSYNENHEQAEWVAYELTKQEVLGTVSRTDNFKSDTAVTTGSASLSDYRGSGFDRGHLAPAADMKFSSTAMNESFYLSNMSPQNASFNRGIWKKLEAIVRQWAYNNEAILVVTGPVLNKATYPSIGSNGVSIPEYYYKVILDHTEPGIKAIGFILPNIKGQYPITAYAVSVDKVEEITGINFFSIFPDDIEENLESQFDISLWSFKEFRSSNYSVPSTTITNENTQNHESTGLYWINSNSNTRHNSGCRYYGNTKSGYYTNDKVGTACGSCGG